MTWPNYTAFGRVKECGYFPAVLLRELQMTSSPIPKGPRDELTDQAERKDSYEGVPTARIRQVGRKVLHHSVLIVASL